MMNRLSQGTARRAGLLVLAATLAACTSLAPTTERPAAPVAATFPGTHGSAERGVPASDLAWQDFFTDERTRRLIALALRNNRDLRVAVLNIEQARAQLQVRRADELPTLNAGVAASRQTNASGGITSLYSAGLQVTAFELDLFGRVSNLSQAALQQFFATEEARKSAQIALVAAVANAALAVSTDDALLALTRQTLATREDSLRLTRLRFDNGAASELDVRQAESLFEAARVSLAQLTRQRALDENALVLLLGQPLPTDLPDALPLDAPGLTDVPAGLPSELLERRPDLRQAERALKAADASIGAARAAFFPRITLTGSVGAASSQLSNLFSSGGGAWSFAPQLLLPLFDSGRNQANLEVAKVNRDIAIAQYEKAVQTAFREVADALAGRATFDEQLRAQQAQAVAEEARLRLADLRYRNGVASFLDVLDAQRSAFAARQAVLQVQAQQAQNRVTLYKVLGGGWTAPEAAAR